MNPQLAAVAAANGGIFTFEEARAAGYTRAQIAHRLECGKWRRLRRGTYALAGATTAMPEVVAAWQRRLGGGAAGNETAALIHGISLYHTSTKTTIIRPSRRRGIAQYEGLRLTSACLPDHHLTVIGTVLVTTPARTVVDIARHRGFASGVVAADSALHLGLTTHDELARVLDDCARWPGIVRATRACKFADPRSETALESLARMLFHERQLPPPELQVWVTDDIRVDFIWKKQYVIGEADGLLKYDEPGALRQEKLRQERLEQMGFVVVRCTYREVTRDPETTAARFRKALTR